MPAAEPRLRAAVVGREALHKTSRFAVATVTVFFIGLVIYYLFRPSPNESSFSNERQYRAARNRVEDKRSYAGSLLVVGLLGGIAVLAIVLAAIAAV